MDVARLEPEPIPERLAGEELDAAVNPLRDGRGRAARNAQGLFRSVSRPSQVGASPLANLALDPGLMSAQELIPGIEASKSQRSSTMSLRLRYVPFTPTVSDGPISLSMPSVSSSSEDAFRPASTESPNGPVVSMGG